MKKLREDKNARLAKKLWRIRQKHKDNRYLENILNRCKNEILYKEVRIKFKNQIVCAYCGILHTGFDHQPPLSRVRNYQLNCRFHKRREIYLKVSCCAECNRILGNTFTLTFQDRLGVLRSRLESRTTDQSRLTFERGLKRCEKYYD